jgi:hypothetical protein
MRSHSGLAAHRYSDLVNRVPAVWRQATEPVRGALMRIWRACVSSTALVWSLIRYPREFMYDPAYRAVNILGLTALVYAFCERVIFTTWKPIFPRAGEVGSIVSDIAIGYIAAWILLYLITWRPAYLMRHKSAPIIAGQTFRVFAKASQLRGMLRNAAGTPEIEKPLTTAELHDICEKVSFREPSSLTQLGNPANHATVLAAMAQYVAEALTAVPRVVELLPYFDSEFVVRFAALQTADLVGLVQSLMSVEPYVSADLKLTIAKDHLRWWFSECDDLWAWMCDNYPREAAIIGPTVLEDRITKPQFDLA